MFIRCFCPYDLGKRKTKQKISNQKLKNKKTKKQIEGKKKKRNNQPLTLKFQITNIFSEPICSMNESKAAKKLHFAGTK